MKKASQYLRQGQKTDGKRQLLREGADWEKEPEWGSVRRLKITES